MASITVIHLNGADASTIITDSGTGSATWAAQGNAQLDTAQQKFGSASLLVDGTGDWVKSTDIGNVLPASGGWTVDCWFRINSAAVGSEIISYIKTASNVGVRVGHNLGSSNKIWLALSSDGSSLDIAAYTEGTKADFALNTWYHLAVVRDDAAGKYYVYVDGVLDQTVTTASQITNTLDAAGVGALASSGANPFNGWIDEFRIANTCLYPSGTSFTPPTDEDGSNSAQFNLTVITLSASGGVLGAAFNLPMLTLAAGNEGAEFNLPMLTLVAAGTTAAQFNLPMLTVTGEGGPLSTYTVEATAPSPTGSATLLTGRALTFENTAPAPTGTSTLISGNALTFEGTAPSPELEMNMKGLWITAPAPELEATLLTGRVLTFTGTAPAPELESSTLDVLVGRTLTFAGTAPAPQLKMDMKGLWITAPAPELEATLLAGSALTFTGTAPSPELEMDMKGLWITAPAPELEATLVTGGVISAVIRAPSPVLVATLSNSLIITAENSAPAPTLVATLATGNILTMALTAREPRLTANILTGEVLTAELTAASPIMEAYGYPAYILTASMVAPAPYLNAFLTTAVGAAYRTWALNTRKAALTEYDWTFNSYCVFGGKVLACNSSGVVELGTELLDNATTIPWRWRTGEHGYGTSLLKRVPRVYVDGSATGDMFFRVLTPEQGTRSYLLPYLHVVGTTQRRVPIGKGIKGKRFQFECENSGDTNFSTNEVIVYPVKLKRRVM